jgi:hypothetical protein
LVVGSLMVMFGPNLSRHMRNSANAFYLNDDARQQIWPFLRYHDPALFQNDYLTDYQLAFNPTGFEWLYRLSAPWIDPRTFSRALPYVLLAVMLGAVGVSAWLLGGAAASWGSLALCLSTDTYLSEMMGGLPRAFGFPVAAIIAASLVRGNPYGVMLAACSGAAFYYPLAVLGAVVLVFFMVLPPRWGGVSESWTWPRKVAVVVGTGALSLVIVLPSLFRLHTYGRALERADWVRYPEAGFGGRLEDEDVVIRPPLGEILTTSWLWTSGSFQGTSAPASAQATTAPGTPALPPWRHNEPWLRPVWQWGHRHSQTILAIVIAVLGIGYARLIRDDVAGRRLLVLPGVGLGAYVLSWMLVPYLYVPERYVKFTLPMAAAVMFPAALSRIASTFGFTRIFPWAPAALTASVCTSILLLLGGRGTTEQGLNVQIGENEQPLYHYLSRLPADVLLAGWPPAMDSVPYLTARRVFVTFETHLPFHEDYVKTMRSRMEAFIDAYFARNPEPIIRLRETFGVTHLVVDQRHYRQQPPRYFAPFDSLIARAFQRLEDDAETVRQADAAQVFRQGDIIVLDLSKVTTSDE